MAASTTSWKKGQSGNPGGKNKIAAELRKRCLDAVDAHVIDYWIDEVTERSRDVMTAEGPIPMVCRGPHAAKCSELLAAYGLGKPAQSIEVTGEVTHNVREMTTAVLDARIAELESHVEH